MQRIITIEKTLQERISDYDFLPEDVSLFKRRWSTHLQFAVEQEGWQAIWKFPRTTCERLKIPFPSVALVQVLEVNELQALVKVLSVQDENIHIADKHFVPLIQLWVIKEEDERTDFSLRYMANVIDALRFFYTNIFMPWDVDDDTSNWKTEHLINRIKLYYNVKNESLPKATAEHITSLMTEALALQEERDKYENELSDSDAENEDEVLKNQNLERLLQIHVRLLEIKSEIEILEDPILSGVIIKRQKALLPPKLKQQTYVVFDQGRPKDYKEIINLIKKDYSDVDLAFVSDISYALEFGAIYSTFILKESLHRMKTTAALERGGRLFGFQNKESTIITADMSDVVFNFSGIKLELENLTIDAKKSKCAILVRQGIVSLKNVKIFGAGQSSIHPAIIVLPRAKLELENCEIEGFCTGIVASTESKTTIKNCIFHNLDFGLRFKKNCLVDVENTVIHHCLYGAVLDIEKDSAKDYISFQALEKIPYLKLKNLYGHSNDKANVRIGPMPDLKPTAHADHDDEMEECNETLVETERS